MSTRKARKRKQPSPVTIDRTVLMLLGAVVGALLLATAIVLINQQQQSGPPPGYVPAVTGAPRVAVSEDVIDYGNVRLNTTIETVFRVQNVGDRPLHILGEPQVELIQGC